MNKIEYDTARNLDQHVKNHEKNVSDGIKKEGDCNRCVFATCENNVTPYEAFCEVQKGILDSVDTLMCEDNVLDEGIDTSKLETPGENPPLSDEMQKKELEESSERMKLYKKKWPDGVYGERKEGYNK